MVEFVGLVKVNVVKGTNLAVRDMMTSDPYVILALGQQVCFFFHKYADIILFYFFEKNMLTLLCVEPKWTNLVKQVMLVILLLHNFLFAVSQDPCNKEQPKSSLE